VTGEERGKEEGRGAGKGWGLGEGWKGGHYGGQEGRGKMRGNFAPTVISKSRRLWFQLNKAVTGPPLQSVSKQQL